MEKLNIKYLFKLGKEQFMFVGVTIFSAGIHFCFSLFVKAFVMPYEYGIYSTCLILQTYLSYLQLGVLNAFNRDYPQLIGAQKNSIAKLYRDTAFTFLFSSFLVATILISVIILCIRDKLSFDFRFTIGLILCTFTTFLTTIENFGNYRSRIDRSFEYTSIVTCIELVSIIVGASFLPVIGYYAIYITNITAMIIGICCYYKKSYADICFGINMPILRNILFSGLPLLINGLIWTVINTIDKFVILGFLNTEALGVYGIAQNAFSYMILIPTAMSQLFYVKMGRIFGDTGEKKVLNNASLRYTFILAMVTSSIALIAYYLLPILVNKFLPNYLAGVPSSQILILGLSVYAATMINGNILTILRKNAVIIRSSIYMCLFNIVCSIIFVYLFGSRIENVAMGTAASYTMYAFIIIYQVHKYSNCDIDKLMNSSVIPICITLIPGVVIYHTKINKIIGLLISILLVVFYYSIFEIKRLFGYIKQED